MTPGAFDLHNPVSAFGEPFVVGVDSAAGWIYYTASPENADAALPLPHPARRQGQAGAGHAAGPAGLPHLQDLARRPLGIPHLFSLRHAADGRPDPPARARAGADAGREPAAARRVARLRRGPAEFVKVDAGGGPRARRVGHEAAGLRLDEGYPVLFHVYGEPAGQTVLDQWDGQDYLWHLMLTQQGYVVAIGGQPRDARRRGAARSGRRSTRRSAWSTRPIRRRRRAPCGAGPGWTRPASASGAGAAAGRPPST